MRTGMDNVYAAGDVAQYEEKNWIMAYSLGDGQQQAPMRPEIGWNINSPKFLHAGRL